MLLCDLEMIPIIDTNHWNDRSRDEQLTVLIEKLTNILTSAHLDGIKRLFQMATSPVSVDIREYIDRIDTSLQRRLNEHERFMIASYINDQFGTLVCCHR
jgi:hypothetical protein